MGGYLPKAAAYDLVIGWTTPAANSSTMTFAGGLTGTVTVSGGTTLGANGGRGDRGFAQANYYPGQALSADPVINPTVSFGTCTGTPPQTCTGLGTITMTFSQPVRNPILQISGLGEYAYTYTGTTVTAQTDFHSSLTLATAGLTLSQVGGNTNFNVTGGTTITTVSDSTSPSCTALKGVGTAGGPNSLNAVGFAGCGSVRINGTFTTVAFAVGGVVVKNPNKDAATLTAAAADAFGLSVTVGQDFSDSTVNRTNSSPVHILSDLQLGATVDEDLAGNRRVGAYVDSPFPTATANGDDTDGTDDEDAFTTLPPVVAQPGATYTLNVPVSGVSKTARLCGYIDFQINSTFLDVGNQACADVAAGATSVPLTWTIPVGTVLGSSFARFRLGYTAAQINLPKGRADSGEVEDYPISILARPQIILTKTTTGAVGGPFSYALTNTTQAAGTVTTVSAGSAVQADGDTATTGTQAYTATAVGTAVTITEAALSGWSVTSATCTNASGAVGSASGATYTIPASAVVSGAVITCAYTNAKPGLTFDKRAGEIIDLDDNGPDAGDQIPYSFVVTNTGQTSLSGIVVTDPKVTAISCPVTTLAAGENTTCTATYTITQGEVTGGSVVNTASVTANPPTGTALTASDANTVSIPANPSIRLTKTAGTATGNTAGSTITYTFVVTNTGNLPLTTVGVSDPTVGPVTCPVTRLDPGVATTCTKTYALKQVDVDAGVIKNTATAAGMPPTGAAISATSSVSTTITRSPSIALDKQAGILAGTSANSRLPYTFIVTNTGNVTLTAVGVNDPKAGTVDCPATTLAPGGRTTCTATYRLSQADVDAGHVANTASVSANAPSGDAVTAVDSTDLSIPGDPSLMLTKNAGTHGNTVGAMIPYTFVVTNNGNVSLSDVGVNAKAGTVTCPVSQLAPGARTTCTATYSLTQPDVDAGHVANTATASGTPLNGAAASATDAVDTVITADPQIALDKSAGAPSSNLVGGTIPYTFIVTNTGNVTLHTIAVSDPKVRPVSCPLTELAPLTAMTCAATYALTLADVNAGHVANSATVSANPPQGEPVSATSSVDTSITPAPSVSLQKHAVGPSVAVAGATILYSLVVTNTGNVTLTNITIDDPKLGRVTCPETTLAPHDAMTCTGVYRLTQADLDAGTLVNTATVTGVGPFEASVSAAGTVTTPLAQNPQLAFTKQADATGPVAAGDEVEFTFLVTNTGNITLSSIVVRDPMLASVSCPVTVLAPGEKVLCTGAPYTVKPTDAARGWITNTAVVSALGAELETTLFELTATSTATVSTTKPLPNTGSPVGIGPLSVSVVILGLGVMLTAAGRRRSRGHRRLA
jgi:uncharacterized repeat protein (TIGR01451 family)